MKAELKYLKESADNLLYVASQGGGDQSQHVGEFENRMVEVQNARELTNAPSLEKDGFCMMPHQSSVENFYDDNQITKIHYPELEELLIELCDCKTVDFINMTRRSSAQDLQAKNTSREPASVVHNDYSEQGGPIRFQQHISESDRSSDLLKNDFAIIHFWCPISSEPVKRDPLAICAAGSAVEADFHAAERRAENRSGELYFATYNKNHQWFYFPNLTKEEPLIFKTFNSRLDGRAHFCLHTAFSEGDMNEHLPPRESMEIRCLVTF